MVKETPRAGGNQATGQEENAGSQPTTNGVVLAQNGIAPAPSGNGAGAPVSYLDQLPLLPEDWRLVPVGPNKAPCAWGGGPAPRGWLGAGLPPQEFLDKVQQLQWAPPAVGLVLGEASGVISADLDDPGEDGERDVSFKAITEHDVADLPPTVTSTSGREGRRTGYFIPDPEWLPYLSNRTHVSARKDPETGKGVTLWEARVHGMAVILGAHPITGRYSWMPGCSPADLRFVAKAPEWLLESMVLKEEEIVPHREPTADDAARATEALEFIPPEEFRGHSPWLTIGFALHAADPALLDAWINWSRGMSNFNESECRRRWKSFGRGAPFKGRPITVGTLFFHARKHGYKGLPKGPSREEVQAAIAAIEARDGEPDPAATQKAIAMAAQLVECARSEVAIPILQDQLQKVGISRSASRGAINKARKEWQNGRKAMSDKRRKEKNLATRAQAPSLLGIDAVIAAMGEGWQYDEETGMARHSQLHVGEMRSTLLKVLGDRLGFDEMQLLPTIDQLGIDDGRMNTLYVKLDENGWKIKKVEAIDAIRSVCLENSYNPVQDYLLGVEADDSIEPISFDEFYSWFHVKDPLQQRFLYLMLLSAVWRAMEPGCELKLCVILVSETQTLFKSLALKVLCGRQWFSDTKQEQHKDTLLVIHASWFYELAEIDELFNRHHSGESKALVSPSVDRLRPPYATTMGLFPRPGILVGSSNKKDFLVDNTGNHRYPIVEITQRIDVVAIEANRDRIWKAFIASYRAGEKPFLTDDELIGSEERNEAFHAEDPWVALLDRWIRGACYPLPGDPSSTYRQAPEAFTTAEALIQSGCVREGSVNQGHSRQAASALRTLGFEQSKQSRVKDETTQRSLVVRLWRRCSGSGSAAADGSASADA
jgi:hypothetical protein